MSTRLNTTDTSCIATEKTTLRSVRLGLENSIVEFEVGPVGTVARIAHDDGGQEYAGPLDDATIAALREVGRDE